MSSSFSLARPIIAIVAVLSLTACTSTPAASVAASPSTVAAAASRAPSLAPEPTASPEASSSNAPTDSAAPTVDPTPDPTPAPTEVAGCGSGRDAYFARRNEIPTTWSFGAATIEFTGAGIGLRDESFYADDVIPAGLGLTRDELAVRVDPGTHILLRAKGATLTRLDVKVVPWSTVVFSGGGDMGQSDAESVDLDWRLRADGSISISAPEAPGDYMVDFHPLWQSACLKGDGSAYGRIKVN